MNRIKTIAVVLGGAGLVAGIVGGLVLLSGMVSVSARPPHSAVTTTLLHTAFTRSVAHNAGDLVVPDDLDAPGRVALGARTYAAVCSNCHGTPGLGQNPIALSMRPSPQYLPAVVGQFTDAELAWIVDNGVKFSAMPAWPAEGRLDETWSVVAFLKQLPEMTPADYAALTASDPATATEMPLGADLAPVESKMPRRSEPEAEYAWTVPASGFGGVAVGNEPLVRCAGCHGVDGRGTVTGGEAPNLTIQTAEYLHAALRSYAEARRHSGFMQPQAATLTDAQMVALADYFSQTPRSAGGPASASAETLARGREIAMNGIPDKGVAGCLSCHERGADEPDKGLFFPSLFGQSETYLRRQLDLLAAGSRGATGIYNPMHAEAHGMSQADRDAVAAWLSAQVPTKVASLGQEAVPVSAKIQEMTVKVCATCHEADLAGSKDGHAPNLTLQTAPYLLEALHSFHLNERHNSQMVEMTRNLTTAEIESLAAFVGGMPPVARPKVLDAAAIGRGKELAMNGDPERELPACTTCHAASAVEALPLFARLDGQSAVYLERRLKELDSAYAAKTAGLNPMYQFARKLTEAERADLAAYFASLPPVLK
ncbi:MAG: c-type cytochrome [Paracoccaceae bacterium]